MIRPQFRFKLSRLNTPHDGDYSPAMLNVWWDISDWTVSIVIADGYQHDLAHLSVKEHRLFKLNPRLRDEIVEKINQHAAMFLEVWA